MKKSFISILVICTSAILFSGIANGQPFLTENHTPKVVQHSVKKINSSKESMSNLVFIPSSHNFGTYTVETIIGYNFQLKNNGGTQESGYVNLINGGAALMGEQH